MTAYQEARVRIAKKSMGDFIEDLAKYIKYAKLVGIDVITYDDTKLLPPPAQDVVEKPSFQGAIFTRQQKAIMAAISNGADTRYDIISSSGFRSQSVARVLNTLVSQGYVHRKEGKYKLSVKAEVKHGQ